MTPSQLPTTPNLSTRLRDKVAGLLERLGAGVHRLGIHPDTITWLSLVFAAAAAVLIVQGAFATAGLILVIGMPLDALDGAVARSMKRTNPFGGVLDSTVDRYADMLVLLALATYLAVQADFGTMLLAFAAVVGSTQVSYIRARAGNAGLRCAGGVFSRFERSVVLLLTLFTGWLALGLAVLAVGANFTALHRLWSVYRFARTAQAQSAQEGTQTHVL